MRMLRTAAGVAIAAVLSTLLLPGGAVADGERVAGSGTEVPAATAETVQRLAGASRYDTAVAISGEFPENVDVAYVATGEDFSDALSAAAAAAAEGGPLLLTPREHLPSSVAAELSRLSPSRIVVAGGQGVVSSAVLEALGRIAPTQRVAGVDRYETSRLIAKHAFARAPRAYVATGRGFADALAATGAAAAVDAPVVLVDGLADRAPEATIALLNEGLDVSSVAVVGGYGAVSAGIQGGFQDEGFVVDRIGGATRYDTAALVNEAQFSGRGTQAALLATGQDYPDALAGAALAGRLGAPVFLTTRDCLPASTSTTLAALAPSQLIVAGGAGVVSHAAAGRTACVPPDLSEIDEDWQLGGFDFPAGVEAPYADRPPVDVAAQTRGFDDTGLLIYNRVDTGQRADHPVAYAQYGISALLEYEVTGDALWLRSAIRHAEQLAAIRVLRGDAWWFPYTFPWSYDKRRLEPSWWSGMAQGEALSLFTRLAEATGEARWEVAADATWLSFRQPRIAAGPWSTFVRDGSLVFEEYAADVEPLVVLNGHAFAVFGLYDYWRHTGDAEVKRYMDGGAQTVLNWMPDIRNPGGISYYCADAEYCQRPYWQNATYHVIHSWQLDTLQRLTGDTRFGEWADLLREDWQPAAARRSAPEPPAEPDPLYPGPSEEPEQP